MRLNMSLSMIIEFQKDLYDILSRCRSIPKVYLSLQQNAKQSFIMINYIKIDNLSAYELSKYQIEFEVCIFIREKSENAMEFLDIVDSVITNLKNRYPAYQLLGIRMQNLKWERGHDLVTNKLSANYIGLISN